MGKSVTIRDIGSARALMLRACYFVRDMLAGGPVVVTLTRPSKTREMEKKYHAMIGDIASQVTFDYAADQESGSVVRLFGRKRRKAYSAEVWKALLVDMFAQEKDVMGEPLRHPGETITSLDGKREVTIRPTTTKFLKHEGSEFIEFLYAQGCEMGVNWSEPALAIYAEYREAQQGRKVA